MFLVKLLMLQYPYLYPVIALFITICFWKHAVFMLLYLMYDFFKVRAITQGGKSRLTAILWLRKP